MVCKNCGKELNENTKFCFSCGAAVSEQSPAQTPAPVKSPKTPFYKVWWLWAILSLLLAVALVITNIGIFDKNKKDSKDDDDKPKTKAEETTEVPTTDEYFEVITEESTSEPASAVPDAPLALTPAELESALASLPLTVNETNYLEGDPEYPSLYPDIISATIKNNSGTDIKSCVIAFAAWDSNNLPVKILGQYDYEGSYVQKVNYDAINLVNGDTYGENSGLALDEDCNSIVTIKAVVVSYEDFDGNTWNNPYYDTWVNTYSEKRLAE